MSSSRYTVRRDRNKALVLVAFLGFTGVLVLYLVSSLPYIELRTLGLTALLLTLISFLYNSHVLGHSLVSGAQVFLLLLFFFHFGLTLTLIVPGLKLDMIFRLLSGNNVEEASFIALLSLVIYEWGLTIGFLFFENVDWRRKDQIQHNEILVILLPIAIMSGLLILFMAKRYGFFSLSYSESWLMRRYLNTRWFGLFLNFFVLTTLLSISGLKRKYALPTLFVLLTIVLPLFLFGFRGFFVIVLLTSLVIVEKKGKISRRGIIAVLLSVLLLVPVIKARRNRGMDMRGEFIAPVPVMAVVEMGGTLRTLIRTIDYIKDGESHWMGKSYIQAIRHVPPNVSVFRRDERGVLHPSAWITLLSDPYIFYSGGGWGYSIIAETYLNFGMVGIFVIFLMIGIIIALFEIASSRSTAILPLYAVFLYPLLFSVRNDFYNFARIFVWGLILYTPFVVFKLKREKNEGLCST